MLVFYVLHTVKKRSMSRLVILVFTVAIFASCTTTKNVTTKDEEVEVDFTPGPKAIIYKTKNDYSQQVPVILSSDKSEIVSFPSPTDLVYKGKPAYPTELKKGYLLDNRGISKDVAFLDITYEEYSNLNTTPSAKDLFDKILDSDPLLEMYNCGNRRQYDDEINELNSIIKNNNLELCRKIISER